jgi:metallo-beta-lactamase class B
MPAARRLLAVALAALGASGALHAKSSSPECKPAADWNQPAPPRRIYANVWYVGTCGLTSLLLTGDDGHVLLDGATERTAPLIEASIRRLGFRLSDVRYILNSHAHFDHAGGIARLQRDTGATVVARGDDAEAIERGRGSRTDPQFSSADAFAPVPNVRRIADGETLRLGSLALTAHATPGHTPGSISWTWDACEAGRCLRLVYADSLTAYTDDQYHYVDHPDFVAALRASIAAISALPCDLLLTPHPDASLLWERVGRGAKAPLIDAGACRRYGERSTAFLEKRLAKEREQPSSTVREN